MTTIKRLRFLAAGLFALASLAPPWVPCVAAPGSPAAPRIVRIAHFQCMVRPHDFEANLSTARKGLAQAREANLDIVSFPECFLTGYYREAAHSRRNALAIDSPQMERVLALTADHDTTLVIGFIELRGGDLYNTVAVIERGRLLGRYSKALPYEKGFKPGREFPVFEKKGLKYGIVICSDGGYIEPSRIVALKGARLIIAPHYNFVSDPIPHYVMVRNDHVARAVENGIYFLRANNVILGEPADPARRHDYGYGDSYLLDPNGQVVAGAGIFHEHLLIYQLDLDHTFRSPWRSRSLKSGLELLPDLERALQAGSARSP